MRYALVGLAVVGACSAAAGPRPSLITTAEKSGYVRTGRYDEAVQLCRDFARAYSGVACDDIGTTGEGRPLVAVRIARGDHRPTIYIQAGIHAGEIEGKDAGYWFLRDLLDGKVAPGALDHVSVVFVPVLNPDGHERFAPNNRPNQRGPEEMGFRTNGARLNLNRDYVKADTPEIQAVLATLRARDPVLLVDLHTTDGAKFEHDISINTAPVAARVDHLEGVANKLSYAITRRLTELGHLPVPFYPSFIDDEDPQSGFALGDAPPRFSQAYSAVRGRLGVLVETHSWRTYKERAASTYHALQAIFETAVHEADAWRKACDDASASDRKLRGTETTLVWKNGPGKHDIDFRGYSYEKRTSDLTGGTWLVYDEKTPQIWKVPLFDELIPAVTVKVPRGGYIIDGGFAQQVAAVLDRHGIMHVPMEGQQKLAVEVYRATKVTHQPPFEGRTRVALEGTWTSETRTLDRGAIFVPIDAPFTRVAIHLLDPALPDSLAQWGFFNAAFERKEYIEPYVTEEVARSMLAADPSLRAKFDADVAADPELAKSAAKKLEWFYKRSPYWDERLNLVPIYKTEVDFRPAIP
jgi:zinc carboxypeptidase